MEAQKKVLVYHYSEDLGKCITLALKRSNYIAEYRPVNRQTKIGDVADELAAETPDLVFLSVNYGNIAPRSQEGLEELVKIRERSKVPVVMVTGGDVEYQNEAFRRGASEYLVLSAEIEQFVEIANRLTTQS